MYRFVDCHAVEWYPEQRPLAQKAVLTMHELSVAKSLIELACDYAKREGASRISRISVRLGTQSVALRSFVFCFGPACRGTMCDGAELDIEEVPLTAHCPSCDCAKTLPSRTSFRCPECGTPTPNILSGREMQLVSLGLEFDEPATASPLVMRRHEDNDRRAL